MPLSIPNKVKRDRTLVRLMSVRRNLLHRYRHCLRRVNPGNPKRSQIEKRRTQERRQLADQLRAIERDCLRWLGEHTKHPDLYIDPANPIRQSNPLDPRAWSHLDQLKRQWREARRSTGSSLNKMYRRQTTTGRTKHRHLLAKQIQDLEWKWLSALHAKLFPLDAALPRRIVHPSRYKP